MSEVVRNSKRLQESCRSFFETTADKCSQHDFLRCVESDLRAIAENVTHPFNVAVFGKMKRGKSTIVNSLLGRRLAITDQTEATATINIVSYAPSGSDLLQKFIIHWWDAPPETYPLSELKKWTGPDGQFERIKYIQLYADIPSLKYHEIIDTPGTESTVEKHQTITQDFLDPTVHVGRKADALVYVLGKNVEEADLKYLRMYQQGGSSSSFNVLCVMHLWDDIYVNNVRSGYGLKDVQARASEKRKELGGLVTDVIPVSAPLAIFVNNGHNRDDLLERAIRLFKGKTDAELYKLFLSDALFRQDSERVALWDDLVHSIDQSLPVTTARVILIESARSSGSVDDVVDTLTKLCGIEQLEDVLDKQFFSKGEILRQLQTCLYLANIKKKFDAVVDSQLKTLSRDSKNWDALSKIDVSNPTLVEWIGRRTAESKNEMAVIRKAMVDLDTMFLSSPISSVAKCVEACSWAIAVPQFKEDERELIRLVQAKGIGTFDGHMNGVRIERLVQKIYKMDSLHMFDPVEKRRATDFCAMIDQMIANEE